MVNARAALERLREGNRRFAANKPAHRVDAETLRRDLAGGQQPFAIIVGCSDSRVPAEIVFDQHLGDLFVIRVAGNVVAPSQIGSIEFAAANFGTRLVVVMGHSNCGAIEATMQELLQPSASTSRNIGAIVEFIRPSVEPLLANSAGSDPELIAAQAVRANVQASVERVRHGSEIIEQLERNDGLLIVGAEYCLETGLVDFFDGAF
ncbi:MAG: carbonic anhydrase [Woeseiaceae bacterium]|jgi:carbonic anhydrase